MTLMKVENTYIKYVGSCFFRLIYSSYCEFLKKKVEKFFFPWKISFPFALKRRNLLFKKDTFICLFLKGSVIFFYITRKYIHPTSNSGKCRWFGVHINVSCLVNNVIDHIRFRVLYSLLSLLELPSIYK